MSKKKNSPSNEPCTSPRTEGEALPTHQSSPVLLPDDTVYETHTDQNQVIPIGVPVSAKEMQRLKTHSGINSKKKSKKKAPDNN